MSESLRIVFALYPDLTHLDFTGPHQALAMTPGAEVIVASERGGDVRSDTGLTFTGLARLAEVERADVICTPGGAGLTVALGDAAYIAEVRRLGLAARYVTSVCTGSLILGAAGLLQGRRAACHWAWRHLLPAFGAVPDAARIVRDGNVITGGGVTAGIDFALALIAGLAGEVVAQRIQLAMEYAPAPPFDAGSPDTAPAEVVAALNRFYETRREERQAAVDAAAQRHLEAEAHRAGSASSSMASG